MRCTILAHCEAIGVYSIHPKGEEGEGTRSAGMRSSLALLKGLGHQQATTNPSDWANSKLAHVARDFCLCQFTWRHDKDFGRTFQQIGITKQPGSCEL
ncbi:hypothetical protein PoB_003006700 [Plakobranchus ocellatus]|uniref:Uncharacterized protein n=1 Tax=Plakobranchus ocellatus TaxID=259542 RepID=A0AAV4A8J0_9GAST|nr:hypothetical protein PoB_003006700 [Plakobranchus ocellatus]